jgi:hypothetical protein
MTKRRYTFGDDYILSQMRLGYVTYTIHPESKTVIIQVRGSRPLLAQAGAQ